MNTGLFDSLADAAGEQAERLRQHVVIVQDGARGVGAGVIWRANGIVVTNAHVAAGGPLRVELADGRTLQGELLTRDAPADVAVLRVPAVGLPAAQFDAERRPRIGELVFAMGHPWGERWVLTAGVVSGLGRAGTSAPGHTVPIIRSDVRLAPGNSGGPLVDAGGFVLGINTMVVGGDLGVAIAAGEVDALVRATLDRRASLGITVQAALLPPAARAGAEGQTYGLMVVGVEAGGAAARAGVLVGDLLVALGGERLQDPRALLGALSPRRPGEEVPLTAWRAGAWRQISIALGSLERAA